MPVFSAFCVSAVASGFAAALALKDCSKSLIISSICSMPTDMRIRSYWIAKSALQQDLCKGVVARTCVTPLSSFSDSFNCS